MHVYAMLHHFQLTVRVITLLSAVYGTCRNAWPKNPFSAQNLGHILCKNEKSERSLDQVPFSHLDQCLLGACASDRIGT